MTFSVSSTRNELFLDLRSIITFVECVGPIQPRVQESLLGTLSDKKLRTLASIYIVDLKIKVKQYRSNEATNHMLLRSVTVLVLQFHNIVDHSTTA